MTNNNKIPKKVIYVCNGSKCKKRGGKELRKFIKDQIKALSLKEIAVIKTGCTDNCKRGPVVCVQPDNNWNFYVDKEMATQIIKDQITEVRSKNSERS